MKRIVQKILITGLIAFVCSGAGYKGKLPDIKSEFEYQRHEPEMTRPLFNHNHEETKNLKLAPAPKDNKTYIDIIMKKEPNSPYLDDINDVIKILEKMQDCIATDNEVQRFNALASALIDNADFMQARYKDKPEEHYVSFKSIMKISSRARAVASLRCEAEIYVKYLPYQNEGQAYSKENVQKQVDYFSKDIEDTLKVLRAAN